MHRHPLNWRWNSWYLRWHKTRNVPPRCSFIHKHSSWPVLPNANLRGQPTCHRHMKLQHRVLQCQTHFSTHPLCSWANQEGQNWGHTAQPCWLQNQANSRSNILSPIQPLHWSQILSTFRFWALQAIRTS
jgi:hypothetical protein